MLDLRCVSALMSACPRSWLLRACTHVARESGARAPELGSLHKRRSPGLLPWQKVQSRQAVARRDVSGLKGM